MKSRGAAAAVVLLLAAACAPGATPEPGPPPSVLLLVIDCLRSDRLSAHGYPRPTTPNLDALVREGSSFTRAYAQASWTRPSLPTILTGLYPSEHTLREFFRGEADAVMSARLPDSVVTLPETLKAQGYRTALIGEQVQLSRRFGLDQGFDHYESRGGNAASTHRLFWEWMSKGEGPFFAYFHYLELHWPYCPPAEVRGTFYSGPSQLQLCRGWRRLRNRLQSGEIVPTAEDIAAMAGRYDEELLALDRELGRLFTELKAKGLWDELFIVLTADHGEQFYEHGAGEHGRFLWEELLAVPLVFKPPRAWGAPKGRLLDPLVESRDLVPTILDAAHAPSISGANAPSLLPWVLGQAPEEPPRRFVVAESTTQVAVRTRDHKLIADRDAGSVQLYDLLADPGETRDLASQRPPQLAEMLGLLAQWQQGLSVPAPAGLEDLDPETIRGLEALGYLDGGGSGE